MKRMISASLLAAVFCTALVAQKTVAKGPSYTSLGNYTIEVSKDPVIIKGDECKAYLITYENSSIEVTVAICKERKCKTYVVMSDPLSVKYVCTDRYFGVEKLDKPFAKDGLKTNDEALNRGEYFHQRVITPGKRGELEATQLIASFFPRLLKNEDVPIASR